MTKSILPRLKRRHSLIDQKIMEAQRSARSDPLEVGALKKSRLSLKDRIARIRAMPRKSAPAS